MPDNIREAWISAGKAIQVSTTLASAKMQEVKSPVQKGPMPKPGKIIFLLSLLWFIDRHQAPLFYGALLNQFHVLSGIVRKVIKGRPPAVAPSQPESSDKSLEKKEEDGKLEESKVFI